MVKDNDFKERLERELSDVWSYYSALREEIRNLENQIRVMSEELKNVQKK